MSHRLSTASRGEFFIDARMIDVIGDSVSLLFGSFDISTVKVGPMNFQWKAVILSVDSLAADIRAIC